MDAFDEWLMNALQLKMTILKSYIVHLGHHNLKHTYTLNSDVIVVKDEIVDIRITMCSNLSLHLQTTVHHMGEFLTLLPMPSCIAMNAPLIQFI